VKTGSLRDGSDWLAFRPVEFSFTKTQRDELDDELNIDVTHVAADLERYIARLLTLRARARLRFD
jgi:hypothetical protein